MPPTPLRLVIAALVAAYPRASVEADTVRAYEQLLSDLPLAEVEAAAVELARLSPHFPAVSEIVGLVMERRLGLPTVEEAWEQAVSFAVCPEGYEPCPSCRGTVGDEVCRTCRDEGRVETRRTAAWAALSGPVRRAYDFVGRREGIAEASEPSVVRAQFAKAYARFRADRLEEENLTSARSLSSGATILALPRGADLDAASRH